MKHAALAIKRVHFKRDRSRAFAGRESRISRSRLLSFVTANMPDAYVLSTSAVRLSASRPPSSNFLKTAKMSSRRPRDCHLPSVFDQGVGVLEGLRCVTVVQRDRVELRRA